MHILQTVYFRFANVVEMANQTHGGELSLPVVYRSGIRLSYTKGGSLHCPYSGLPTTKREVPR
jgi:hypothetical protein